MPAFRDTSLTKPPADRDSSGCGTGSALERALLDGERRRVIVFVAGDAPRGQDAQTPNDADGRDEAPRRKEYECGRGDDSARKNDDDLPMARARGDPARQREKSPEPGLLQRMWTRRRAALESLREKYARHHSDSPYPVLGARRDARVGEDAPPAKRLRPEHASGSPGPHTAPAPPSRRGGPDGDAEGREDRIRAEGQRRVLEAQAKEIEVKTKEIDARILRDNLDKGMEILQKKQLSGKARMSMLRSLGLDDLADCVEPEAASGQS